MEKRLGLALVTAWALCAIGLTRESDAKDGDVAASCMEVEVNGERAPSFPCLTQKLSGKTKGAHPPTSALTSEAIAQRPSNQLGLFNREATSQRMGNTFGTSVFPQRPERSAPATPFIPRAVP
jgi:hypothetical protein